MFLHETVTQKLRAVSWNLWITVRGGFPLQFSAVSVVVGVRVRGAPRSPASDIHFLPLIIRQQTTTCRIPTQPLPRWTNLLTLANRQLGESLSKAFRNVPTMYL